MPLVISFLVTGRCTLECRHCFYHEASKDRREELSIDQYELLSRSLGDLAVGIFAGGEPFMRRDLAEIVRSFQCNSALLVAAIASNGQLTGSVLRQTEAICRSDRSKLVSLSLSLDGFRDTHDSIRGSGAFDRAVRTWRELRRLSQHFPNLQTTLTTVVSTLNQDSARAFVKWASATLKPDAINILLVRQSPRAGDGIKRVRPECYRDAQSAALESVSCVGLVRKIHPYAVFSSAMAELVHRTMITKRRTFHCFAGVHGAVVDFKGDVSACEVLMEQSEDAIIGNLDDFGMSFPALWTSPQADRVRRLVNRHEACQACTHETMGYVPSLLFAPNKLGFVLGPRRTEVERPQVLCRIRSA